MAAARYGLFCAALVLLAACNTRGTRPPAPAADAGTTVPMDASTTLPPVDSSTTPSLDSAAPPAFDAAVASDATTPSLDATLPPVLDSSVPVTDAGTLRPDAFVPPVSDGGLPTFDGGLSTCATDADCGAGAFCCDFAGAKLCLPFCLPGV